MQGTALTFAGCTLLMAVIVHSQGFSWVHEFNSCPDGSIYDTAGLMCSVCSSNQVLSCLLSQ